MLSTDLSSALGAVSLTGFQCIDLHALNERAALLKRVERKYVVDASGLGGLLDVLRFSHSVLDIDGRRSHTYQTTYFDTPDLLCFRAHNQGRSNRFKLRVRRYEDSGLLFCELKEKTRVSATLKSRVGLDTLSDLGQDFAGLLTRVQEISGRGVASAFAPTLEVRYRRATLFDPRDMTRLTIDIGLSFGSFGPSPVVQTTSHAIIEVKSARAMSLSDRLLRDAGLRPLKRISKYCVGMVACGGWTGGSRFRSSLRHLNLHPGEGTPVPLEAIEFESCAA